MYYLGLAVVALRELFGQEPLCSLFSPSVYEGLATRSSRHRVEAQNYLVLKMKEDAYAHFFEHLQVSLTYIWDCFFESLSQIPSKQFGHPLH